MGWNPFKKAKDAFKKVRNTLGDYMPTTNRGLERPFDVFKNWGDEALMAFGAYTGNPYISAAGNLLGGLNASKEYEQRSEQDWKREYDAQKEFAQFGVRWRAADARAAGLSPLAAMGGQFASYSNQVGGGGYGPTTGELLSQFGQDISRAQMAKATQRERDAAAATTALYNANELRGQELRNQGMHLENMLKLSELVRLREGVGLPPPMPTITDGGAPVGAVVPQASSPIVGSPGAPAKQPGRITDYQELITESGKVVRVPSVDAKQAMEDNIFLEIPWSVRNQLIPEMGRLRNLYMNNLRRLIARGERAGARYQASRPYSKRRYQ